MVLAPALRPPGPRGPGLLALMPRMVRNPLRAIQGLAERHGDVVCVGRGLFYLVWRPEHVEHVLVTSGRYGKGLSVQTARAVFGDGLVMSDGDLWRRQRRLMQPFFLRSHLARLAPAMVGATEALLERWEGLAGTGRPVDVTREMLHLLQQAIVETMFGADLSDRSEQLSWAQERIEEYIDRKAWNPIAWTDRLPTRRNREATRAMAIFEETIHGLIDARRREPHDPTDLLSALLHARDDETGQAMSARQLRDELMTIFFTGHGTTAYALSWAWYLLSQDDAADARVADEARRLGRPPDPAEESDADALDYTRRVFDETLRLYPPAWIMARTAEVDDELGGYPVPAGMAVLLATHITHRHPDYWPDPETFDPDRFLPAVALGRPRLAWYPFGAGQRTCIGKPFALFQAQLTLSMIARRFRLRLAGDQNIETRTATVLRPRRGIRMLIERRS